VKHKKCLQNIRKRIGTERKRLDKKGLRNKNNNIYHHLLNSDEAQDMMSTCDCIYLSIYSTQLSTHMDFGFNRHHMNPTCVLWSSIFHFVGFVLWLTLATLREYSLVNNLRP